MREVMLIAPSYKELEGIYMARKLFIRDENQFEDEEINEIHMRFAKAYLSLKSRNELRTFTEEIRNYIDSLNSLGIDDEEIKNITLNFFQVLGHLFASFVRFILCVIFVSQLLYLIYIGNTRLFDTISGGYSPQIFS